MHNVPVFSNTRLPPPVSFSNLTKPKAYAHMAELLLAAHRHDFEKVRELATEDLHELSNPAYFRIMHALEASHAGFDPEASMQISAWYLKSQAVSLKSLLSLDEEDAKFQEQAIPIFCQDLPLVTPFP